MSVENQDQLTGAQLFNQLWETKQTTEQSSPEESAPEPTEPSGMSPSDILDSFNSDDETGDESSDNISPESEESATSLPSEDKPPQYSPKTGDIEEVMVKGPEGRKQKLKINYSDRNAVKQAFIKAAGMRKFQAERDSALKAHQDLNKEYDGLKSDFAKIEKAFEEHGARGVVELLGGETAWQKAVDDELKHRDYVNNLTAEEKYQLELENRDKKYQKQLEAERLKREEFQKQIEEKENQSYLRELESKLYPAFDRYRFAGKLGDPATENLYDEAIWGKVKERLAEYPDTIELNQAVVDKEFRTVANMFRKHIKAQTEKQVKKTVENKKFETMRRAQVAAKKGLGSNTKQRQILESLKQGNLSSALELWKQG